MPKRKRGTVKWFNSQKGFGFIVPEDVAEDVFVHHTAIEMDGYRQLDDGQRVEFELCEGDRGLYSSGVRLL